VGSDCRGEQDILFIIDRDAIDVNHFATPIVLMNGIEVIVFSSHSTHFIPFFDVCILSLLKVKFQTNPDVQIHKSQGLM
jgi:hypothetical protein